MATVFSAGMLAALPAAAQVKIGFITTLSTPAGYLGEDARDGFLLAVEEERGRLGGVAVQVVVEDDKLQPAAGKQIAEKFLQSDKIKLFSGLIFSNVAAAVVPDLLAANAIFVSPNAAPSNFAGKGCHKNYFVASWQNDSLHAASGALAQNLGYKRMVLLAPNYQARTRSTASRPTTRAQWSRRSTPTSTPLTSPPRWPAFASCGPMRSISSTRAGRALPSSNSTRRRVSNRPFRWSCRCLAWRPAFFLRSATTRWA
jgi:hypothetical protein